jgi:hypothetical protein
MHRFKLAIVGLIFIPMIHAQKAKEYYATISKAESYVIAQQLDDALQMYKEAFEKYDTPFVRDLFQATIVAMYSRDTLQFHHWVKQCLLRGISKSDLLFFCGKRPKDITLHWYLKNYEDFHTNYVSTIDYRVYIPYIELDLFGYINVCEDDKTHNKNRERYFSINQNLGKRYAKLIDSIGYPTEKNAGIGQLVHLKTSNKSLKEIQNKFIDKPSTEVAKGLDRIVQLPHSTILCSKNQNLYGFIPKTGQIGKFLIYSRTGNNFLWHHHPFEKDTFLFEIIKKGVDDLYVSNYFLACLLERSILEEYDFCITHGSKIHRELHKFNVSKRYNLQKEDPLIAKIDRKRATLYLRPIQKEAALLRTLLYLDSGEKVESITNKLIKKNGFLLYSFLLTSIF